VTFWYGDAFVRLDTHALAHEGRVNAAGRFALQDLLVVTAESGHASSRPSESASAPSRKARRGVPSDKSPSARLITCVTLATRSGCSSPAPHSAVVSGTKRLALDRGSGSVARPCAFSQWHFHRHGSSVGRGR